MLWKVLLLVGSLVAAQAEECALNTCQNGGQCFQGGDYQCCCPAGFTGTNCETEIACHETCLTCIGPDPSDCLTCDNNWKIQREGITGTCMLDPCAEEPCQNYGLCESDIYGYYLCFCECGYTGMNCETDIDDCVGHPCLSDEFCEDGINSFVCTRCHYGFDGDRCEHDMDDCEFNFCLDDASCIDHVNRYTCTACPPEYTGEHCDERVNECDAEPCQNDAKCVGGVFGHRCYCLCGFTGAECEIDIDDCEGHSCYDDNSCHDNVNGFECTQCPLGFTGPHCQQNIDDCAGNPCLNYGQCIDGIDEYHCICQPDFSGNDCQMKNPCYDYPCGNWGECIPDSYGFYYCVCDCGYTGFNCETDIDDCVGHPCLNDHSCQDRLGGFTCTECPPGFSGNHCEQNENECDSSPCQNQGTCHDGVNGYQCRCEPGFTGTDCETAVCENSDCPDNHVCLKASGREVCLREGIIDCNWYHERGVRLDGVYLISIRGYGAFPVYCELVGETPWTIIQRRFDGGMDFDRTWDEYKLGFGDLNGEFWLGNEHIRALTSQAGYTYRQEGVTTDGIDVSENYNRFLIGDESQNYRLRLGDRTAVGTSGIESDLNQHTNYAFSTKDRDNDAHSTLDCAEEFSGGWWYSNCIAMNLNGPHPGAARCTAITCMSWNTANMKYLSATTMKIHRDSK